MWKMLYVLNKGGENGFIKLAKKRIDFPFLKFSLIGKPGKKSRSKVVRVANTKFENGPRNFGGNILAYFLNMLQGWAKKIDNLIVQCIKF